MNFSNNFTPKYTLPEERDFLSYLDDVKYEKFMADPDNLLNKLKQLILILYTISVEVINWKIPRVIIKQYLTKI